MSVVASDIGLEDKHLKAVIQRVSQAQVTVNGQCTGKIERGLIWCCLVHSTKIQLRSFNGWSTRFSIYEYSAMKWENDLSVLDVKGDLMVVSQFIF